jgi:hypothetical protein
VPTPIRGKRRSSELKINQLWVFLPVSLVGENCFFVFLLFYFAKQWLKLLIIEKQEVLDENLEDPGVDSKDDQIPSHSETRYRLLIPIHKVYGFH